jgi:uncharacterized protein YajQ (UPF0234 family)
MPSFDVVSDLDMMEVENAINQAQKEIATRFDFRGGKSEITLEKEAKKVKLLADDDLKMRAMHQIIEMKMAKRGIDLRCMKYDKEEAASGNMIRQNLELKSGIDKENAKEITKAIKDSKLKVTAQIQDEQVRVTAKSIDELQATIQMLKRTESIKIPLQFINMRR